MNKFFLDERHYYAFKKILSHVSQDYMGMKDETGNECILEKLVGHDEK